MKFFNREKEIKEVLSVIESEPQLIYFIYGPINSGKSALIREIIRNRLDKLRYVPFLIDFRLRNIANVDNFIKSLFKVEENIKAESIKEYIKSVARFLVEGKEVIESISSIYAGVPISIPVPKEVLKGLFESKENIEKVEDVYVYIENLFSEINKYGKVPILVLDELQMLKDISLNGNRPLLKNFFQFLVGLTKVEHLAHIFCVSSDSLFIEHVYSSAELENRADYILVDDFERKEALEFIDFLTRELLKEKIVLSKKEKEKIYDFVGGKPVLLIKVINKLKIKTLDEVLSYLLQDEKAKIKMELEKFDYVKVKVLYENQEVEVKKEDVIEALRKFKNKDILKKDEVKAPVYYYLVRKNILFLDPIKEILKPQSRLTWHAINRALKDLNLVS